MKKDIKQFLQEELEKEEIATMKEVDEDIDVQGLTAPKEMDAALFAQIASYEAANTSRFTPEEEELMRLGRVYKRRRRYTKYYVLAATLGLALAISMTSLGGPKKIIRMVAERIEGNKSRVEILTDDGSLTETDVSEDKAYQQVKEKWNVEPVRLQYLPEKVAFEKIALGEEMQLAQLEYQKDGEVKVLYQIMPSYSVGSLSSDMEESILSEYVKNVQEVSITIKCYQAEDKTERWFASFVYQDVQYFLWVNDVKQTEMEKIVEKLYFL